MIKSRRIKKVEYQILSPPEGDGIILEFLDENEDAFMEISVDSDNRHIVTFYITNEHISLPLSEIEKGIKIAKEKVKNTDIDSLFDS